MADVRDAFLDAHVRAHPEDGSSLGLREHASRLSDPSRAAAESELAALRATLAAARACTGASPGDALRAEAAEGAEATGAAALAMADRLDLDAVVRLATHQARWIEQDRDASNLELAALPNAAVQHSLLHADPDDASHTAALEARLAAVPPFLEAHAANLRRGARDGRGLDRAVLEAFVSEVLPGAARALAGVAGARPSLAPLALRASNAYLAFASFARDELAPHAGPRAILGEDEVRLRLRGVMGLDATFAELLAFAEDALASAHQALVRHVRDAGNPRVRTADDARDALLAVLAPRPLTIDAALALYRGHLDAATRLIAERALVPLPPALSLSLEPLPAGIAVGGTLTNWPAPLLDPRGRGHALYATDPSAHPLVQIKNLAVHEGIPGHYLQSACWQARPPPAVRFLGVLDDVAMSRSYFGAMLSVEGWAVHMEQVMYDQGFYDDGPESIFFAFCDAVRAMRVLLDLRLHAEGLADEDAVALVQRATLMPEAWAHAQVLRSKRIPLQGLTYLIGAREIAALRASAAPAADSLAFHGRLLDAGPVPPSRLRTAFS